MISPASLTEGAFGASLKPVGAGPFRVRSFESNVRTIMDRNDGYRGGGTGRPADDRAPFRLRRHARV